MKPGSTHVMLMRLKRALGENEKVPVTFTFEKAGAVTFYFPVAKVAPLPPMELMTPAPMDHKDHKHGG
jgi:copper(I)-binding protein